MMTTEEAFEYLSKQKGETENNPQGDKQEPATETADSQPETAGGGEWENTDYPPSGASAGGEVRSETNGGTPESSEH